MTRVQKECASLTPFEWNGRKDPETVYSSGWRPGGGGKSLEPCWETGRGNQIFTLPKSQQGVYLDHATYQAT